MNKFACISGNAEYISRKADISLASQYQAMPSGYRCSGSLAWFSVGLFKTIKIKKCLFNKINVSIQKTQTSAQRQHLSTIALLNHFYHTILCHIAQDVVEFFHPCCGHFNIASQIHLGMAKGKQWDNFAAIVAIFDEPFTK